MGLEGSNNVIQLNVKGPLGPSHIYKTMGERCCDEGEELKNQFKAMDKTDFTALKELSRKLDKLAGRGFRQGIQTLMSNGKFHKPIEDKLNALKLFRASVDACLRGCTLDYLDSKFVLLNLDSKERILKYQKLRGQYIKSSGNLDLFNFLEENVPEAYLESIPLEEMNFRIRRHDAVKFTTPHRKSYFLASDFLEVVDEVVL